MNTTFQEKQQENNALGAYDNMLAAYIISGKVYKSD
jgi:hypothetical protein